MSVQTITTTVYRLFLVTFPAGEEGQRQEVAGYFSKYDEAIKVANLKRGAWGTSGSIRTKDFISSDDLPFYFDTAVEWGETTLTVKEFRKANL